MVWLKREGHVRKPFESMMPLASLLINLDRPGFATGRRGIRLLFRESRWAEPTMIMVEDSEEAAHFTELENEQ